MGVRGKMRRVSAKMYGNAGKAQRGTRNVQRAMWNVDAEGGDGRGQTCGRPNFQCIGHWALPH